MVLLNILKLKNFASMKSLKIEKFKFDNKKLSVHSNLIRQEVFVDEQHVTPEIEYDEFETVSNFYLLFYDSLPIGTARWRETSNGIKLERFALIKKYRNKGLGSVLLKEVLKDVIPLKGKIYLHAQVNAITYYERVGFVKKGNMFIEADIEHFIMEYETKG